MSEKPCTFEELGHTADVGLRIRAASAAALYSCAAEGLFDLLGAEAAAELERAETVIVDAIDAQSLLVDWLNELLFLHETSGEVVGHCWVTAWSPTQLTAEVIWHRPVHPPHTHVKATTYHLLQVEETPGGWLAEVYFDL